MVFIKSSFIFSISRGVFEGTIDFISIFTGLQGDAQRYGLAEHFIGPLTNTVRTPIAKAIWGFFTGTI